MRGVGVCGGVGGGREIKKEKEKKCEAKEPRVGLKRQRAKDIPDFYYKGVALEPIRRLSIFALARMIA